MFSVSLGLFSAIAAHKNATSYAFEPSATIRKDYTEKTARENGIIIVCPYALGSEEGKAFFNYNSAAMSSSKLSENNNGKGKETEGTQKGEEVLITTIDAFVKNNNIKKIDFIKADMEGAEREMLKGASETLKNLAPKLAICTYHLPDDKQVLEGIIKRSNPDYHITHAYKNYTHMFHNSNWFFIYQISCVEQTEQKPTVGSTSLL